MCLRKCQVCGSYFIPWETYSYFILLIFKLSAEEKPGAAPEYSILLLPIIITKNILHQSRSTYNTFILKREMGHFDGRIILRLKKGVHAWTPPAAGPTSIRSTTTKNNIQQLISEVNLYFSGL